MSGNAANELRLHQPTSLPPSHKCPECKGRGYLTAYVQSEHQPELWEPDYDYDCPTCGGSGVLND